MARILEHDALRLISDKGVAVTQWRVAASANEIAEAVASFGGRAVVKALIPSGGRGKAGLIRLVSNDAEIRAAADILGNRDLVFPVEQVLVSEALDIAQELFVSFCFDSKSRGAVLLYSAAGGVEIESIPEDQICRHPIDLRQGLDPADAAEIAGDPAIAEALVKLYELFAELEAETVEVNPLAVTTDGRVVAPTGVILTDDQAAFRHPELSEIADPLATNGYRPLTDIERAVAEINELPDHSEIRFNELDEGEIGFVFLGGGAGYYVFDRVLYFGGKPANTMDGTSSPHDEESMYRATSALLKKPGLKGLVAGSNYGNFRAIDARARGVVRALIDAKIDPATFPVVI
ncbi:MAG TPA: hypothetical protein DCE33_16225, partial [Rhodospirillaceae bacterium]|nr:hypothetical protein [Rhodospirillaceae bacterium]